MKVLVYILLVSILFPSCKSEDGSSASSDVLVQECKEGIFDRNECNRLKFQIDDFQLRIFSGDTLRAHLGKGAPRTLFGLKIVDQDFNMDGVNVTLPTLKYDYPNAKFAKGYNDYLLAGIYNYLIKGEKVDRFYFDLPSNQKYDLVIQGRTLDTSPASEEEIHQRVAEHGPPIPMMGDSTPEKIEFGCFIRGGLTVWYSCPKQGQIICHIDRFEVSLRD